VALSREWILTAGYNADLNDDGSPDAGWAAAFHLPDFGTFGIAYAVIHPSFSGFANPSINDDIAPLQGIPGSSRLEEAPRRAIGEDGVLLRARVGGRAHPRHYLNLTTTDEAQDFWRMLPPGAGEKRKLVAMTA